MGKNLKKLFTVVCVLFLTCHLFAVEGVVTYVKGKVEVNRNDSWVTLKVGDKVSEKEVINTGFQSEAKVKLMNNVLYLGPVTRITLSTLSTTSERDKVNIFLSTGTVRSKVNRTDNRRVSYSVRTPIAVASVRGTDMSNSSTGKTTLYSGKASVILVDQLVNSGIGKIRQEDKKKSKEDKKFFEENEDSEKKNNDSENKDSVANGTDNKEPAPADTSDTSKVDDVGSSIEDLVDAFTDRTDVPEVGNVVDPNRSYQTDINSVGGSTLSRQETVANNVISAGGTESTRQSETAEQSVTESVADAVNNAPSQPTTGSVTISVGFKNK